MKATLNITGRVELSHQEVTQAVFEFLERNYPYKAVKAVYLPSNEKFEGVVVEVKQAESCQDLTIQKFGKDPKKERENPGGHTIRNRGVFDTIRAILNDAFKAKSADGPYAIVKFDDILRDVVFQHPGMDRQKMGVYLHDRRQIPNIDFSMKMGIVTVKGTINHI